MVRKHKGPGRPKGSKNQSQTPKGNVIKIRDFANNPLAAYLDAVAKSRGLPTRTAAGQLVLNDALTTGRFLSNCIDTTLASETTS